MATFTNPARPNTKRHDYIDIMIDMWGRGVKGEAAIVEAAARMARKHPRFSLRDSRNFYRFLVENEYGPGEYIKVKTARREPSVPRDFNVVIERDEDGYYIASVPSLPGCHTQAQSLDELIARIREAIEAHLGDDSETREELEFVGVQRVTVAA